MRVGFVFALTLLACTPAVRTRTALDAIDVAYSAAMRLCVDREGAIVVAAKAGRVSADEALVQFDAVSQRCYRTRAAFEAALTLIEDGHVAEAEAALAQLLEGVP